MQQGVRTGEREREREREEENKRERQRERERERERERADLINGVITNESLAHEQHKVRTV